MTITTPGQVAAPEPLQLANISVDYDAIEAAIMADLQQQGSWSELLPSGTGSALVRYLSIVTAFMQGGTARALQEGFGDTARTPGGVLRAQRLFQGGGIIRRRAGSVACTVDRTDQSAGALGITAYGQWTVGGVQYFNRDAVVVPGAGSADIVLYQGTVTTAPETSDGSAFQRFVVGTPYQWDLSDDDLYAVDSAGNAYTTVTALWRAQSTDRVFRASTLPDGTVECRFGDGNTGAVPPPGQLLFVYASLLDATSTAGGPPVGSPVTPPTGATLTGVTTGGAAANQDQPPPEFYKAMGPGAASNNGRAVSAADYRAIALKYDGVIDACFRSQRQLNPSDVRYMNVVDVTLITTRPWTEADWIAFKTYFETDIAISNVYLSRVNPQPVPVPISMLIGATPIADLTALESQAADIVTAYFQPRAGSLGATLYTSDLTRSVVAQATYQAAPNEAGSLVDYLTVTPDQPITVSPIQYVTLGSLSVQAVLSQRGASNPGIAFPPGA